METCFISETASAGQITGKPGGEQGRLVSYVIVCEGPSPPEQQAHGDATILKGGRGQAPLTRGGHTHPFIR